MKPKSWRTIAKNTFPRTMVYGEGPYACVAEKDGKFTVVLRQEKDSAARQYWHMVDNAEGETCYILDLSSGKKHTTIRRPS